MRPICRHNNGSRGRGLRLTSCDVVDYAGAVNASCSPREQAASTKIRHGCRSLARAQHSPWRKRRSTPIPGVFDERRSESSDISMRRISMRRLDVSAIREAKVVKEHSAPKARSKHYTSLHLLRVTDDGARACISRLAVALRHHTAGQKVVTIDDGACCANERELRRRGRRRRRVALRRVIEWRREGDRCM